MADRRRTRGSRCACAPPPYTFARHTGGYKVGIGYRAQRSNRAAAFSRNPRHRVRRWTVEFSPMAPGPAWRCSASGRYPAARWLAIPRKGVLTPPFANRRGILKVEATNMRWWRTAGGSLRPGHICRCRTVLQDISDCLIQRQRAALRPCRIVFCVVQLATRDCEASFYDEYSSSMLMSASFDVTSICAVSISPWRPRADSGRYEIVIQFAHVVVKMITRRKINERRQPERP